MAEQVGDPPPTVAADETSSQPSTSAETNEDSAIKDAEPAPEPDMDPSSESDASIDYGEYEHRKDVLVKKLVLCEQQMARFRVTAKFTRLKDYDKRKELIRNRTDPEYLTRVAGMEKVLQKEQDKQETHINLELASLTRVFEGNRDLAERGYQDREQYRKFEMIYDQKRKVDKIRKRIWREDDVRSDVRLFVGDEVPDEWLDEFVKEYVDEEEESENGPEAVRKKNLKRYRMETCDSLDQGQSLSGLLDKALKKSEPEISVLKAPLRLFEEAEAKRMERVKRKEAQKMREMRFNAMSHNNFGHKRLKEQRELIEEDLLGEEDDIEFGVPNEELASIQEKLKRLKEVIKAEEKKDRDEKNKETDIMMKMRTAWQSPIKFQLDPKDYEGDEEPECSTAASTRKKNFQIEAKERVTKERQRRTEEEKNLLHTIQSNEEERVKRRERRQKELEKMRMERDELRRRAAMDSDEEEENNDYLNEDTPELADIMREGVQALLETYGRPESAVQNEPRVSRLRNTLRTVLDLKRDWSKDPELQQVRHGLMWNFVKSAKKKSEPHREGISDLIAAMSMVEETARDSSLVNSMVKNNLKRPLMDDGWFDIEGRAEGAVARERKRREQLSTYFETMREDHLEKAKGVKWNRKNKIEKTVRSKKYWESDSEDSEELERRLMEEEEESDYSSDEDLEEGIDDVEISEQEKAAKERKMREIRAVMEGRDPTTIENDEKEMEDDDDVVVVEEKREVKKEEEMRRFGKMRNTERNEKKILQKYYGSDSDEDYGSSNQQKVFDAVPASRLAIPPKPRMTLQLSQDRILMDLHRIGALRDREIVGEHMDRMDRGRKEGLLSDLPTTSTSTSSALNNDVNRLRLLSPRSRKAAEDLSSVKTLSKKERRALLDQLPSTSKRCYEPSSDEDEDGSDEELSEGWELEEEKEEVKKEEVKEEDEDDEEDDEEEEEEVMEIDDISDEDEEEAEVKEEQPENPRKEEEEEMRDDSSFSAVSPSPLLLESKPHEERKKSLPRMNGYTQTGAATVV